MYNIDDIAGVMADIYLSDSYTESEKDLFKRKLKEAYLAVPETDGYKYKIYPSRFTKRIIIRRGTRFYVIFRVKNKVIINTAYILGKFGIIATEEE